MILEIMMVIVVIGVFLGMLYLFKEFIISVLITASFALVVGAAFHQLILWVAFVGIVLVLSMFFMFFFANRAED